MNDDEIRRLFEADPAPTRPPGYWGRMRAALAAIDAEEPTGRGRFLLAAAAVLVVGGLGTAAVLRSGSTPTATTTGIASIADDPVTADTDTDANIADSAAEDGANADPTVPAALVNQAEPGLRFDFGAMARIDQIDGEWWIWFDRFSVDGASGVELDEPFSTAFASDAAPIENVNPGLRTYRLADGATVELIDPAAYEQICGGEDGPDQPVFTSNLDDLPSDLSRIAPYWWDGTMTVSLSFNDNGEVSVLSDSRGC